MGRCADLPQNPEIILYFFGSQPNPEVSCPADNNNK